MLTKKQIINHLRICAIKGVNASVIDDVVMPMDSGFEALSDTEQFVLRSLYMEYTPLSADEVARKLSVSKSTVYRIRKRALDILQLVLDDEYLEYNNLGKAVKI